MVVPTANATFTAPVVQGEQRATFRPSPPLPRPPFATRVHMLGQSKLDYIDRHGYWDHPQGEGNLRWNITTGQFHNLPMVKDVKADQDHLVYLGVENLVTEKAWEQVLGMPMTISEWNTCLPNEYSLEGTGLMAAYGLLQGWDGSLEFGYFSSDFRDALGSGSFDLFGNPPQILQFPAAAAMWHRRDVKEADVVAESLYDPTSVYEATEDRKPVAAALVGKVGYRFVDKRRAPVAKDISKYWDPKTLTARSITGELIWNGADGVVTIDTPLTQAVIGFLSAGRHALQAVTIQSPNRFGAIWVTAMDDREPVRSARHVLITATGPARNTGMEYEKTTAASRLGALWHSHEGGRRSGAPGGHHRRGGDPLPPRQTDEGVDAGHHRQARQSRRFGHPGRQGSPEHVPTSASLRVSPRAARSSFPTVTGPVRRSTFRLLQPAVDTVCKRSSGNGSQPNDRTCRQCRCSPLSGRVPRRPPSPRRRRPHRLRRLQQIGRAHV